MKKELKTWLITAICLITIGLVTLGIISIKTDGKLSNLSSKEVVTNIYEINEDFNEIFIDTTYDVELILSNDKKCLVECVEQEDNKNSVIVKDGKLKIENIVHFRLLHFDIGNILSDQPKVTVYLSKEEYSSLVIDNSAGDIKIPNNLTFENIDISTSAGDIDCSSTCLNTMKIESSAGNIKVEDLTCEGDADIKTSAGDINLNDVIVSKKLSIKSSAGDIEIEDSDAKEIYIKASAGDVRGTLLSEKIFDVDSSIGKVEVPNTTSGGKCEIKASAGDINISISK